MDTFLRSLFAALGHSKGLSPECGTFHSSGSNPRAFHYVILTLPEKKIITVKMVLSEPLKSLADFAVSLEEANVLKRILTPPEGVVVLSGACMGTATHEGLCIISNGCDDSQGRGAMVTDYPFIHVPWLDNVLADSTRPETVQSTINKLRVMEVLPVVIALCDEGLAVKEAFRLAQMDYRVYVLTDSRPVRETVLWLRRFVDPWVFSEYLSGVIALRRFFANCPQCAEKETAPNGVWLKKMGVSLKQADKLKRGKGCHQCAGVGFSFQDPVLALELLNTRDNDSLANAISERKSDAVFSGIIKAARGATLEDRTRALLLSGRISQAMAEHGAFRRRVNT
jgi:hypothetical protein